MVEYRWSRSERGKREQFWRRRNPERTECLNKGKQTWIWHGIVISTILVTSNGCSGVTTDGQTWFVGKWNAKDDEFVSNTPTHIRDVGSFFLYQTTFHVINARMSVLGQTIPPLRKGALDMLWLVHQSPLLVNCTPGEVVDSWRARSHSGFHQNLPVTGSLWPWCRVPSQARGRIWATQRRGAEDQVLVPWARLV